MLLLDETKKELIKHSTNQISPMNSVITYMVNQLIEIKEGHPWVGNSYSRKLSEVDESMAFARPSENVHSIAKIIAHLTMWRNEAILKINTGKGSKTDDSPENWLSDEALISKGWHVILSEHNASMDEFIKLLSEKEDSFLDEEYYDTDFKGNFPYSFLINGMLHHDIYHLGQIGLLVRQLS